MGRGSAVLQSLVLPLSCLIGGGGGGGTWAWSIAKVKNGLIE